MCVVSFIGDHYTDLWKELTFTSPYNPITQLQFDVLKKEVEHMKALLIKAKLYDEQNGEPDCEMDTKIAKLKEIATLVGISLDDVFIVKNRAPLRD
jgi:hypothetical protein